MRLASPVLAGLRGGYLRASGLGLLQILSTFASLFRFHKADYVYPDERINDCWEKVLLNQCEFLCP